MIVYKDQFLSPDEINFCLKLYNKIDKKIGWSNSEVDFWDGRIFDLSDCLNKLEDKDSYLIFLTIIKRMQSFIIREFKLSEIVYPDTMQIVKWPEGYEQHPHADNSNIDGTPNNTPWRKYSGVIYLNDDYSGGETYFTNMDCQIEPLPGRIAIFYADMEHEHGVRKVRSGERKTIVTFWSHELIDESLRLEDDV